MRMNAEANPAGTLNLADRISALQQAQLSHSGAKKPVGGMAIVLPEFAQKNEPQARRNGALWLVDSDTWENWADWPDENDVTLPDMKRNGFYPESSKVGDAFRSDSNKARGAPVAPLGETSFHGGRNINNPGTEPETRERLSNFLATLSLTTAPEGASKAEYDETEHIANTAATAYSKLFESRADKKTKSQKRRVKRSIKPSKDAFEDVDDTFVQTLSSTSSSHGVTSWLRSMWEDTNESSNSGSKLHSSNSGSKQHSESFEPSFQSFDFNASRDYKTDEWFNFLGREPQRKSESASLDNRERGIEHRSHTVQSSSNDRANRGPHLPSATTVSRPELREVYSSRKSRLSRNLPSELMHTSYAGRRGGILGIEERIDECEAPQESLGGTDVAVRGTPRVVPPVPSISISPSKEAADIDRLLNLLDPVVTGKREADSEDFHRLAARTRSPFDSRGQKHDGLSSLQSRLDQDPRCLNENKAAPPSGVEARTRSLLESRVHKHDDLHPEFPECSMSSDGGLSEIRNHQVSADPNPNDVLVSSRQSRLHQAPRCHSGHKAAPPSGVEARTRPRLESRSKAAPPSVEARTRAFFESRVQKHDDLILEFPEWSMSSDSELISENHEVSADANPNSNDDLHPEWSMSSDGGLSEIRNHQESADTSSSPNDYLVSSLQSRLDQAPRYISRRKAAPRLDPPASETIVAKQPTDAPVAKFERAKPVAIFETEPTFISETDKPVFLSKRDKPSGTKETLSMKIKETLQKKSFASLWKEASLQTETQSSSGDGEISTQSSFAVLGGEKNVHVDVDSEHVDRGFRERSTSQKSGFSPPRPSYLTTIPKSADVSFNAIGLPSELRNHATHASDPIRDYWRNFATVKARGSFDSVSIVNDKDGVVAHSSKVGWVHGDVLGHVRIEEYDYEPHQTYNEDTVGKMKTVGKRVEIREPREVGQGRSADKSNYSRAAKPGRHEIEEELPTQASDRLLYVMSPLLSGDTDQETEYTDDRTQYTDIRSTYTDEETRAESVAAEKCCAFMCGGLELSLKGFSGCS
jgi:hypothetical protein